MYIYLYIFIFMYQSIYLSICLSIYLSIYCYDHKNSYQTGRYPIETKAILNNKKGSVNHDVLVINLITGGKSFDCL